MHICIKSLPNHGRDLGRRGYFKILVSLTDFNALLVAQHQINFQLELDEASDRLQVGVLRRTASDVDGGHFGRTALTRAYLHIRKRAAEKSARSVGMSTAYC